MRLQQKKSKLKIKNNYASIIKEPEDEINALRLHQIITNGYAAKGNVTKRQEEWKISNNNRRTHKQVLQ